MLERLSIIILFLLFSIPATAQNLTGIWKGYFSSGFGSDKKYYNYELQIDDNQGDGHINGISYSYLDDKFYGKTSISGNYSSVKNVLQLKENAIIEVKAVNKDNVYLMDLELYYSDRGDNKVLEGRFSSYNPVTKTNGSIGTIELSQTNKSEFHKENFLLTTPHKTYIAKNKNIVKQKKTSIISKTENPPVITNETKNPIITVAEKPKPTELKELKNSSIPIPMVIKNRKNKLIQTVITHTKDVDIDFFDNGEIDGDSISLYLNNKQVIKAGRLSRNAINFKTEINEDQPVLDYILVAENLGRIPPNSALMVIYTNHKRYEIFIESDLKTNGQIRIIYEPPTSTK